MKASEGAAISRCPLRRPRHRLWEGDATRRAESGRTEGEGPISNNDHNKQRTISSVFTARQLDNLACIQDPLTWSFVHKFREPVVKAQHRRERNDLDCSGVHQLDKLRRNSWRYCRDIASHTESLLPWQGRRRRRGGPCCHFGPHSRTTSGGPEVATSAAP